MTRNEELEKREASLIALYHQNGDNVYELIRDMAESLQLHVERHREDAELIRALLPERKRVQNGRLSQEVPQGAAEGPQDEGKEKAVRG